jgi:hypothetical protein
VRAARVRNFFPSFVFINSLFAAAKFPSTKFPVLASPEIRNIMESLDYFLPHQKFRVQKTGSGNKCQKPEGELMPVDENGGCPRVRLRERQRSKKSK